MTPVLGMCTYICINVCACMCVCVCARVCVCVCMYVSACNNHKDINLPYIYRQHKSIFIG